MVHQTFKDIVLTDEDLAEIEWEIERQEIEIYGGLMPARNKAQLRSKLRQEMKEGYWSNRDYNYGNDEGEAPKGAEW